MRREAPELLGYLIRRTSQAEDAADLLADVLLVVWRRVDKAPTDEQAMRMWLFGIARKTLATHQRGMRRRLALTERLRSELSTTPVIAGINGNPNSLVNSSSEQLQAALDTLSPDDQEVIKLIHFDQFTPAEVAQHLRLRPATARSRHHRARTRLARALIRIQSQTREPS